VVGVFSRSLPLSLSVSFSLPSPPFFLSLCSSAPPSPSPPRVKALWTRWEEGLGGGVRIKGGRGGGRTGRDWVFCGRRRSTLVGRAGPSGPTTPPSPGWAGPRPQALGRHWGRLRRPAGRGLRRSRRRRFFAACRRGLSFPPHPPSLSLSLSLSLSPPPPLSPLSLSYLSLASLSPSLFLSLLLFLCLSLTLFFSRLRNCPRSCARYSSTHGHDTPPPRARPH
jgi:hypothetical protein